MSIKLMAAAWETDLPSTEKMVLLCLCNFASDDGGNCWPSVAKLADLCSTSERTVQRAIRSLETRGILDTNQRLGTSSQYRINPRQIVTPVKMTPPTQCHLTPDTVSPKPSRTTNNKKHKRAIPANWWPEEFGPNTKSRRIVDSWSEDELATQVEAFTAHHTKVGSKFECWQSAWSTWVINSEKFKPRQTQQRGSSLADIGDEVRQLYGY